MTQTRKPNLIWRGRVLLVAFLAPVLILLVIYIMREIFPFGDQMYLRSDMYHQYAPFLKLFQSTLKDGGSLLYSWNIGPGSNYISTYAYYLASPLNWIVALFPRNLIPEIMSGFIILKSGLMSASLTYYLIRKFKKNNLVCAVFGIFYALSGYMAAYNWNVMWLDCLVLLPLIILGLERLVKEGKFLLYTICFGLSVISNYYIAIMLCIFTVLYFIYLMAAEAKLQNASDVFRRIGRYLLFSLIGGLLGAVVFVPAFLTLLNTASAGSSFPTAMKAYFNLLELFAHGMMNVEVTMLDGYVANIYAGVAVFGLVPLFWLNRKISIRAKAGKTALMAVLLFSFAFNVPAFIWHGFHFPNSLPSRQSFLYIFLVLVIGYEALMKIRDNSRKQICICFGAAIVSVFVLQVLYNDEAHPVTAAYLSAFFLAVYGGLFLLWRQRKQALKLLAVLLILAACISETLINMDVTGFGTTSRAAYTSENDATEEILDGIADADFYRVEKYLHRTKNDGAWDGYRSASVFSSVTTEALSDFYDSFGMQHGTNSFSYYGNTPLTAALLSVRYKLSSHLEEDPFAELVREYDSVFLYRNKYCLPPGFLVKRTTKAEVNPDMQDPFLVQNDFLDAAARLAPVFDIREKINGEAIRFIADKDGDLYFYLDQKLKSMTITKQHGGEDQDSHSYSSLGSDMIVYAGRVKKGDVLELTATGEESNQFGAIPAYLDEDALSDAIASFSENALEVQSFSDTSLEGSIEAKENSVLFTSIPYDKGWTVYVDGTPSATDDFYGAFLMVPLSAGSHTIRFVYSPPGMLAGVLVSIAALAALVILAVMDFQRKKRGKTDKKSIKKPCSDNMVELK